MDNKINENVELTERIDIYLDHNREQKARIEGNIVRFYLNRERRYICDEDIIEKFMLKDSDVKAIYGAVGNNCYMYKFCNALIDHLDKRKIAHKLWLKRNHPDFMTDSPEIIDMVFYLTYQYPVSMSYKDYETVRDERIAEGLKCLFYNHIMYYKRQQVLDNIVRHATRDHEAQEELARDIVDAALRRLGLYDDDLVLEHVDSDWFGHVEHTAKMALYRAALKIVEHHADEVLIGKPDYEYFR